MPLTFDLIRNHPTLPGATRQQAEAFLQVNKHQSRIASIFSNQQRWLMAHIGMALYFQNLNDPKQEGLSTALFVKDVLHHNVTSRNTATAFLSEMLKYGIITRRPHPTDRRKQLMAPSDKALEALMSWVLIHLATLDSIDAGSRQIRFHSAPARTSRLQPLIASALLQHDRIRNPSAPFAHFMWMNCGFLITERLMTSLRELDSGGRYVTSLTSVAEMTSDLTLSRSHSARKIAEAEEMGILGWCGTKGRSPIWVSSAFVETFLDLQAVKLAIIDEAFDAAFPAPAA
jgi:DNA-binding MarR family transcriptional regulator